MRFARSPRSRKVLFQILSLSPRLNLLNVKHKHIKSTSGGPPNIPVDFHVFYLRVKPIFAGEIKIMENLPLTLSTPNLPKEAIMYSMMLVVPHREVLSQMGDDGIINRFLCRNDPKFFIHTLKRSQFDQFFFFNQLHRSKISLSATNTAAPKPRKC